MGSVLFSGTQDKVLTILKNNKHSAFRLCLTMMKTKSGEQMGLNERVSFYKQQYSQNFRLKKAVGWSVSLNTV